MSVDIANFAMFASAAEALDRSPQTDIETSVPVYDNGILHPVVSRPQTLGEPFTFEPFTLAATKTDDFAYRLDLLPSTGRLVGEPTTVRETLDYDHLSRVGYRALRADIQLGDGKLVFSLFGYDGSREHELTMPDSDSELRLVAVTAGQIMAKAYTAISSEALRA
jgi:hypothetical protein